MEELWQKFKNNVHLRRLVVLLIVIIVLYELRAMMNVILLTFIFTYLIVHWIKLIQRHFPKISSTIIVAVTYLLIIAILYFVVTVYVPLLVKQLSKIFNSVISFYQGQTSDSWFKYINQYVSRDELIKQAKNGMGVVLHTASSAGSLTVSVFMSLILSFFYTIELKQMREFSKNFVNTGYLAWFFQDLEYFGKKFTNTFGVVLEAQFLIAICNTGLTMIGLVVLQMPQIIALGLMVFVLSLIPVAGVIISLVPLSLVGYSVGGLRYVIYLVVMIAIIHGIEAYILNPKFMASKTELPIFYTFLILLVAEHLWGTWGLIVGVPIFTFLLEILDIHSYGKNKRAKRKLKQ
jgi:predicted PurR-regulated permease PerM